ncbi:hypothetical protein DBR18_08205 [Pseudomonas sp. HMWF021]|nr:hypothetical protein DBR18_08205 [Pseudomonas sp. HMWF021]
MSPKTPFKPSVTPPAKVDLPSPPTRLPDTSAPHGIRPPDIQPTATRRIDPADRAAPSETGMVSVEPSHTPTRDLSRTSPDAQPIDRFWLSPNFLRNMQPADAEGFRYIVGRTFVDVEHEGVLRTVHAVFDPHTDAWRAKLLTERLPSGPPLLKDDGKPTWRLASGTEPAPESTRGKRPASVEPESAPAPKVPRPTVAPVFIDENIYTSTARSPDAQGYYELEPRFGVGPEHAARRFAFEDEQGRWVEVAPPARGFAAQPEHLPHWTDKEIWQAYELQGQDIERFRTQSHATGRPAPGLQARLFKEPLGELVHVHFKWLHPTLDTARRQALLQSCNLLPSQLLRLREDLRSHLALPEWVETHKRQTEDAGQTGYLERLASQMTAELNLKREARHPWYSPQDSLTETLRETLLANMGYRRNINRCLYRTDIPALFRGDDRTPFELAADDAMLPRYNHQPGATTDKPISATFSLGEARVYASKPDPEYLLYNSQTNRYPGKTGSGDESDSASTSGDDEAGWSDTDTTVAWNHERNYTAVRTRQSEMFIYVLDTRGLEVVPREENYLFNSAAAETSPTWFPDDHYEGLVSVTGKGIGAERIWLLDSTLSKAARVQDIADQAGASAERITQATHSGQANKHEYDNLIHQLEMAGKPVLQLSGQYAEFGHDINWPE